MRCSPVWESTAWNSECNASCLNMSSVQKKTNKKNFQSKNWSTVCSAATSIHKPWADSYKKKENSFINTMPVQIIDTTPKVVSPPHIHDHRAPPPGSYSVYIMTGDTRQAFWTGSQFSRWEIFLSYLSRQYNPNMIGRLTEVRARHLRPFATGRHTLKIFFRRALFLNFVPCERTAIVYSVFSMLCAAWLKPALLACS